MWKVFNKSGATMNHQLTKEIAGADARRIMEDNIRINKNKVESKPMIIDGFVTNQKYVDVADARKQLIDYQRNYDRTAPEALTDEAKNAMWKRAKQLKDEFIVGMLSQDELHPVRGMNIDGTMKYVADYEKINSNRSVERNTAWYKHNEKKLVEFKNIMRHLNPDNPGASDIEKFRPQRRTV